MAYLDLAQHPGEMRRIFRTLGLAVDGDEVRAQPLAGGVSSGIYRVDLPSGSYCVKQALPQLKVAKEWKVPVERAFAEIDYLEVAGGIVPGHVPRVLGHDRATKSFVMEFLGAGYRSWKADLLAGRVELHAAREVGDVLGRIHAATAHSAALAERFATDANFHAIRLDPYLLEAGRVHPRLAARLAGLVARTAGTRRVLVHGDVSPKNILLGPAGCVLLDAECAWYGDPAFDAAFCMNHFLLKAAHVPEQAARLVAAFGSFAEAYAARVQWEPWPALADRITTLLPGLALARVDGKSPVEYLTPAARARVRDLAIALLDAGTPSLATIAGSWEREFAE